MTNNRARLLAVDGEPGILFLRQDILSISCEYQTIRADGTCLPEETK